MPDFILQAWWHDTESALLNAIAFISQISNENAVLCGTVSAQMYHLGGQMYHLGGQMYHLGGQIHQ